MAEGNVTTRQKLSNLRWSWGLLRGWLFRFAQLFGSLSWRQLVYY